MTASRPPTLGDLGLPFKWARPGIASSQIVRVLGVARGQFAVVRFVVVVPEAGDELLQFPEA